MENSVDIHRPIIVGIGEVLWDVFPNKKLLGGAAANFAFYCGQLEANAFLVSMVGNDDLGREALNILSEMPINLN